VWEHAGTYYMNYDGAGPKGWLACLATSKDLVHWTKRGAVLALGAEGSPDSASASYGVTFFDGVDWHLFMSRIFQAATLDHHAGLLPPTAICLYYEGRSLV